MSFRYLRVHKIDWKVSHGHEKRLVDSMGQAQPIEINQITGAVSLACVSYSGRTVFTGLRNWAA